MYMYAMIQVYQSLERPITAILKFFHLVYKLSLLSLQDDSSLPSCLPSFLYVQGTYACLLPSPTPYRGMAVVFPIFSLFDFLRFKRVLLFKTYASMPWHKVRALRASTYVVAYSLVYCSWCIQVCCDHYAFFSVYSLM